MSLYAEITDLYLYGLPEEARGNIANSVLTANLQAASSTVDGYLVGRYGVGSMPLVSWSVEVTQWACWIAVYEIMSGPRGFSSEAGADSNIRLRWEDAHRMLSRVQRQDYTPVGLVPQGAQGSTAIQPLVLSWSAGLDGCQVPRRGW